MAKFGFSPLEKAAQSAREEITRQSEQLTDAAQRQKNENVYYRNKPLWHIGLYAVGIVVMWLIFSNFQFLRQLLPMGLELLKGVLPAGFVAEKGAWLIDGLPRFHEKLDAQVSQLMMGLVLVFVVGYMLHGIASILAGSANRRFISTLERTAAEMNCRMVSIDEVSNRLQKESVEGFKPLAQMNNIRLEAETLLKKSEQILSRNLRLKKVELLVLTALSAAAMLMTLMEIHRAVFLLNLQGRTEALMVTIVTIVTLAFYMSFIGKRLLPFFPKIGKWLLRAILLGYAAWLNWELIVVQKQTVDLISFFCLTVLPIPEHIYEIIAVYVGPVLLSLLEIRAAMGIVKTTDAAAELKADREGIVIPMTDGSRQITKPAKARRMGVMAVIRPAIFVALGAGLIAFLINVVIADSTGLVMSIMSFVVVFIAIIMSVQGLSTDRFEMKYKRKGAKIQGMFVLIFILLIVTLCPSNSIMIFNEDMSRQLQEEQQAAQEQQEMQNLSRQVGEMISGIQQESRFSCEFELINTETGELMPKDNMYGAVQIEISVDREAKLAQQTVHYAYEDQFDIQDYSWPAEGMEQHYAYNTWAYAQQRRYIGYLKPDGSWADREVSAGQWVKYVSYGYAESYANGYSDYCSFGNATQNVTELVELGQETVDGVKANHYMIKSPYQYYGTFDQWDNYGNIIASFDTAEEYYNAVISDQIKERYPEMYQEFMEVVDRKYNQDNEIHLWFDESGRLVRMEQDWTYKFYSGTFSWGDAYALSQVAATGILPVTNVQTYSYGEMAIPMQMPPEDALVLN